MHHGRLRRLDLDIAAGVVERAVRHIMGILVDKPGMRWGLDRLKRVHHLRCILVIGMWNAFEDNLAGRKLRPTA
jgi:hypothetical protein